MLSEKQAHWDAVPRARTPMGDWGACQAAECSHVASLARWCWFQRSRPRNEMAVLATTILGGRSHGLARAVRGRPRRGPGGGRSAALSWQVHAGQQGRGVSGTERQPRQHSTMPTRESSPGSGRLVSMVTSTSSRGQKRKRKPSDLLTGYSNTPLGQTPEPPPEARLREHLSFSFSVLGK